MGGLHALVMNKMEGMYGALVERMQALRSAKIKGIVVVVAILLLSFTFTAMLRSISESWKAPPLSISLADAGHSNFRDPGKVVTSLSDLLSTIRHKNLHYSVTFSDGPSTVLQSKPTKPKPKTTVSHLLAQRAAASASPHQTTTPAQTPAKTIVSDSSGASPPLPPISDSGIEPRRDGPAPPSNLPSNAATKSSLKEPLPPASAWVPARPFATRPAAVPLPARGSSAAIFKAAHTMTNSSERGVVLFALETSSHDNLKKLASAAATLSSARANARQGVLRAHLFTTLDLPPAERASWDTVTVVPSPSSGVSPDLYALSLLPNSSFRYSLVLPPGNTVCGDVHDMLDILADEKWHVLMNSGAAAFGGAMNLGIMGWSKGPEFRALHTWWLEFTRRGSRSGARSIIDYVVHVPQAAKYRVGVLARPSEVRFSYSSPGSVIMSSALITGAALAYPTATSTTAAMRGLCTWAGSSSSSPGSRQSRVFVYNLTTGSISILSSKESICAALGNQRCTDAWTTGAFFVSASTSSSVPLLQAYPPDYPALPPTPSPASTSQPNSGGVVEETTPSPASTSQPNSGVAEEPTHSRSPAEAR